MTLEHVTRVRGAAGAGEDRVSVVTRGHGLVIALAAGGDGGDGARRAAGAKVGGGARAANASTAGARAAELAVARLAAAAQQRELDPSIALKDVDRQLAMLGGQAAVVLLAVTGTQIRGASVGDAAAWIVSPDGNVEMLTARQHRKPLLGAGASTIAFTAPFAAGTLVVGSDGLFSYASTGRIVAACAKPSLDAAADALMSAVELPTGALQADVALVLCRRA
jgi:hypothetical protein